MITLASDFGSPYPAAMKGVLCQLTDARLVDVSHDFPRQDVRTAAFWLHEILPYFPPATHLVVVDPGVGTERNALLVRAGGHTLVGPDNGVLLPPARALADGAPIDVFTVEYDAEPAPAILDVPSAPKGRSTTFHGRDVFAPIAAAAHRRPFEELVALDGVSPAAEYVELTLPEPTVEAGRAVGEVLAVDDFGNVITNVPGDILEGREQIVANRQRLPVGSAFADVSPGDPLAVVGSHGRVELDVNRGRGDEWFGLERGDEVVLERDE